MAPSVPSAFTATVTTDQRYVNLTWDASIDSEGGSGLDRYEININDEWGQ